jgi:hypothetical protein
MIHRHIPYSVHVFKIYTFQNLLDSNASDLTDILELIISICLPSRFLEGFSNAEQKTDEDPNTNLDNSSKY